MTEDDTTPAGEAGRDTPPQAAGDVAPELLASPAEVSVTEGS
jgi:hypothetical protein